MAEQAQVVDIYIMGKHYKVLEGLTILTSLEYCGYRLIRGCGCRIGSCGACATVYNFKHDPKLRYGLACQTAIEQDMCVVQIPSFPTASPLYDLKKLMPTSEQVLKIYSDLVTCFGCNNCTRSCPQELEVMEFISAALRGSFSLVVKKSFECVMCGMCAARCSQGLSPHNVALLYRRLYGRYLAPNSKHLENRIAEIEAGQFDEQFEKVKKMPIKQLRRMYEERWIEPSKNSHLKGS